MYKMNNLLTELKNVAYTANDIQRRREKQAVDMYRQVTKDRRDAIDQPRSKRRRFNPGDDVFEDNSFASEGPTLQEGVETSYETMKSVETEQTDKQPST
tara:strand:- start:117 stop:413 length:297 start_codon:yes stop_codon:yes gene_type:complete